MFIGVARTRDVDAYLRGVAASGCPTSSSPRSAPARPDTGARPPGPPAGAGHLGRLAASTALTWDVERGNWSVVVMNADGSPGVAAAVSAGAKVPYLASLAWSRSPSACVRDRHGDAHAVRHAPGGRAASPPPKTKGDGPFR